MFATSSQVLSLPVAFRNSALYRFFGVILADRRPEWKEPKLLSDNIAITMLAVGSNFLLMGQELGIRSNGELF